MNSDFEIQVPSEGPVSVYVPTEINIKWQNRDSVHFDDQVQLPTTGFHRGPNRVQRWKIVLFSFAGAFIDTTAVLGLSLLFVACALLLVRYFGIFNVFGMDELKQGFAAIFIQLAFFYMVFVRSYLGQTLGDWACGLRLGSPIQRRISAFTARVLLRGLVIFATGIIVIPLLSLIFACDLAGKISGVSLVRV